MTSLPVATSFPKIWRHDVSALQEDVSQYTARMGDDFIIKFTTVLPLDTDYDAVTFIRKASSARDRNWKN